MNLKELHAKLKEALEKLEDAGIDDDEKLDLELLINDLEGEMKAAEFDVLKEISEIEVPDISKLSGLIDDVDDTIEEEGNRVELTKKIISIAQIAIKAAGIVV